MKTLTQLSIIALGLAAAVYAANPVLEAQEGNTLLIDNFEDGDLTSELGPWVSENDNGDGGKSTIETKVAQVKMKIMVKFSRWTIVLMKEH